MMRTNYIDTSGPYLCDECGATVPMVYGSGEKNYCMKCLLKKYKRGDDK